ncbi:recombinase RecT [Streptomyces roseolus]|uniref:recombinase RecT n=1 Tax=Streptomyces roseolus TaxID=67358 RepID=UPI0037B13485
MALSSLKDRVRAATITPQPSADATVHELAADPQTAVPQQLQAAAREDGADIADLVHTWLERHVGDDFAKALPKHIDVTAFLSAVREILPGLVRCTPASVRQALITCARFGLLPDGKHAVIKAEGNLAVFVPMAQGYVELMYRSGRVGSVHVGMIHEGDEWTFEPTAPAPLDFTHRPAVAKSKKDRGRPILAYAFAWMASGARSQVVILSREDAEEIRDEYSQAYRRAEEDGSRTSFWHTDFDAMWRKSALRRLHKVVPMSPEMVAMVAVDEAGDEGRVQVTLAPEDVALVAEADEAHERAEDGQDPADGARAKPTLRRKTKAPQPKPLRKRQQPKRTTRRDRSARR